MMAAFPLDVAFCSRSLLVPSLSLFVAASPLFVVDFPVICCLLPPFVVRCRLFVLVILCPLIAFPLFVVFLHAIHAEAY